MYVNYASLVLRASAATSGTSEQDAAVTLPETVNEIWVFWRKTAEAETDNLLTIRLQAQVGSNWFDLSWDSLTIQVVPTSASDNTANVTREPNVVIEDDSTTFTRLNHYLDLPSNVIRTVSISSGTNVANTWQASCYFQLNRF